MSRTWHGLGILLGMLSVGCTGVVESDPALVEREARSFMDAHGEDRAPHDAAIAGRVSAAEGPALKDVVIQVQGTDLTAVTGVEGRYRVLLPDSAVGRSVSVTATYIGFLPAVDSIELVRGENAVDFLLRSRPTDAATERSPHPPIQGIDVIGRDRGSTDGFDAENQRFDVFLDRLADGVLELPDGTVAPFVDGRPPVVYLGRERVEDLSALSDVDRGEIVEIVILSQGVARTLYGPDGVYGVITISLNN